MVNLTWSDNSSNEDNFVVERSSDQTNWSTITLPANSFSYSDTVLNPGVYYYRVRATNTAGTSSNYSNTARVVTQLLSPTGLTATSPSPYQVVLSWTDNASSEKFYTVERSPDGSTNWTVLSSTLPTDSNGYSDVSVIRSAVFANPAFHAFRGQAEIDNLRSMNHNLKSAI